MELPWIYLIILLAYMMLMFSFFIKNYIMMILSCLLMFALSIYTFVHGIDTTFTYSNFVVKMFSAVTFGIAAYVSLKATTEIINQNY